MVAVVKATATRFYCPEAVEEVFSKIFIAGNPTVIAIDMEWDKFVNSHGLNEFDRMDVVREYYRQMASSVPNMQDAAGIGNQAQTMQAAQIAFSNFVAKSTKFNEHEKNIVLTTPKEIKTVYITGEQPLPGRNLPNIKY